MGIFSAGGSGGVKSFAKSGDPALTGAVTISGGSNVTLTQAGQDVSIAASGGGTAVTARQQLAGSDVTIANGGNDVLTWNTSFGPNVLLDRTDTGNPAVLTAGIYHVALYATPGAMTVGGSYGLSLELDRDGEDSIIAAESSPASAGVAAPSLAIGFSWYIPAGGTIRVTARNHDGVAARTFSITSGLVQKIT